MLVTYIVPAWKGGELGRALASIQAQSVRPAEVLVIFNGIPCPFPPESFSGLRAITLPENIGFAGACRLGMDQVRTPFAALINDDCILPPDWAAKLLALMEAHPETAAVTGVTVTQDGTVQVASIVWNRWWEAVESPDVAPDALLNFTAVLLRMDAVRAVGGLEPRFFAYYEDVDLCLRLKAKGFKLKVEPDVKVIHQGSQSAAYLGSRRAYLLLRNRNWVLLRNFGWGFYFKNLVRIRRADLKILKRNPLLAARVYPFLCLYPRLRTKMER